METGKVKSITYEEASMLITDFKELTNLIASSLAQKFVDVLNDIFGDTVDIADRVIILYILI